MVLSEGDCWLFHGLESLRFFLFLPGFLFLFLFLSHFFGRIFNLLEQLFIGLDVDLSFDRSGLVAEYERRYSMETLSVPKLVLTIFKSMAQSSWLPRGVDPMAYMNPDVRWSCPWMSTARTTLRCQWCSWFSDFGWSSRSMSRLWTLWCLRDCLNRTLSSGNLRGRGIDSQSLWALWWGLLVRSRFSFCWLVIELTTLK